MLSPPSPPQAAGLPAELKECCTMMSLFTEEYHAVLPGRGGALVTSGTSVNNAIVATTGTSVIAHW